MHIGMHTNAVLWEEMGNIWVRRAIWGDIELQFTTRNHTLFFSKYLFLYTHHS